MKLSIITTTFNSVNNLPTLVDSLRHQTDLDFEWIVADGNSTDGTIEYLNTLVDIRPKITCQEDFGIYDALNRGIKNCSGDYYVFIGADDIFNSTAVESYKKECDGIADIVTAPIEIEKKICHPTNKFSWLYGQHTYISGFAVGCAIRKNLHNKYGYFSSKYPIAADQLFILSAVKGNVKIKHINEIAGRFITSGLSSMDITGSITEFYRVQIALGSSISVQTFLALLRILKNWKKIQFQVKKQK